MYFNPLIAEQTQTIKMKRRIGTAQFNVEIPSELAKKVKKAAIDMGLTNHEWSTAAFEFYLKECAGSLSSSDEGIVTQHLKKPASKPSGANAKPAARKRRNQSQTLQ